MVIALVVIFVVGYAAIVFEHSVKINKTVPALFAGVLMWALWAVFGNTELVSEELEHHLYDIAQILFFLMGAMTIVELVDAHQGFKIITNRITTRNARKLMWIISLVTFFMSAALDNLTTAIVMVSLLRRLVHDDNQRLLFVGMVVVAANAGGAWSPIGDVTTTMLWIGGQISTGGIIHAVFLPSLVCMLVPLSLVMFKLKGDIIRHDYDTHHAIEEERVRGSKVMFFVGTGMLLFVPVFKTITHLPPFMGIMLALAVVWALSEILHVDKTEEEKKPYTAIHALSKIDSSAILFFLGILLAVSTLQGTGVLGDMARAMDAGIGNREVIALAIGLLSAIVDNVPLVAAVQKMYSFPMDHEMWSLIAYTAGTGGSCLIIGSAAGVALMGMERINFFWYVKNISWLALAGYFAGAGTYMLMASL
ncbi:MAG: sodium:proton antiporter NhaD [Porticoccaceae bacterium]